MNIRVGMIARTINALIPKFGKNIHDRPISKDKISGLHTVAVYSLGVGEVDNRGSSKIKETMFFRVEYISGPTLSAGEHHKNVAFIQTAVIDLINIERKTNDVNQNYLIHTVNWQGYDTSDEENEQRIESTLNFDVVYDYDRSLAHAD